MAGNLRVFLAELAGTFGWVFFCGGAVCADAALHGRLGPAGVALAQGLAVASIFGSLGKHTLGLCNPAFTAALALLRRVDPVKAALCLVCQLLGAVLAALLLSQLFAHAPVVSEPPYLGAPIPNGIGFRGATILEAVSTFFLAAAAWRVWRVASASRALVLGAVAAAAALVGGQLSGAAMNPARAFGPAVVTGYWSLHYVYWAGPLAGALLGISFAHYLFEK